MFYRIYVLTIVLAVLSAIVGFGFAFWGIWTGDERGVVSMVILFMTGGLSMAAAAMYDNGWEIK